MKDLFNFKVRWKRIGMRAPLLSSSLRMIFKWVTALAILIIIGWGCDDSTSQFSEKESKNSYDPWTNVRTLDENTNLPRLDENPEKITVQITGSPTEKDGMFWQITNIIESKTSQQMGFQTKSEGKFVKLILIIKNQSIKTKIINIQEIQLVDHKNRHFPLVTTRSFLHDDKNITLKPDIPVKLKLLFEVAEDSEDYLLNFDYGFGCRSRFPKYLKPY